MESYLSPNRIANAILQKAAFKGSYLIVEGNNDYSLYKKFTNEEYCKVEIAFGNQNVIDVIEELTKRGFYEAVGIIDSDFRKLDNETLKTKDVFITDEHDLEMMIFNSEAFETIISHYCIQSKVESFRKENENKELREIFLQLALPLGYLKWANKKHNFGLVFKPSKPDGNPLSISDFIPPNTLKFTSYENMTQTVINYTVNKSDIKVTKEEAINKAKKLIDKSHSLLDVCNGHDIMHIISLSLRKKISNMNSNTIKPEQLEKEFIFAFDSRHFEQTNLYKELKKWESKKKKQILKF